MKLLLAVVLLFAGVTQAGAVPMANRHYQTPVFVCDGIQHNDSLALDYGQVTQIHAVNIIRDQVTGANMGHMNVSQDFFSVDGQFRILSIHDEPETWRQFSPNTIQLPQAQAIALEWGCVGGGTRQYTVEIWFTGGGS